MTGPEHYREAERLRDCAKDFRDDGGYFNAAAQAHAILALAAATALGVADGPGATETEAARRWREVVL